MTSGVEDRRIRFTKQRIRQSLTQLLMEKDLREISVMELTQRADINRGTFYLHYKDVYQLFEQIEQDALDDFMTILSRYKQRDQVPLLPMLQDLFQFIADNAEVFIALLRTKETTFLNQITEMSRPKEKNEWQMLFPDGEEEHNEYYYAFLAYGCIAMLRHWFDRGMKESPAHMAGLAERMIVRWQETGTLL